VNDPVLQIVDLGAQWPTVDPFLFCVHHDDAFPAGDGHLGPGPALGGRRLGSDFSGLDGWSMYHGTQVPGFPRHPHRGFETVTFVRRGLVDHADSLGAAARYGRGDVQWMTAGAGIVHAEMFPLLHDYRGNPLELFQIWLNLPAADKMAEPHFTMLWSEHLPHHRATDDEGSSVDVTVIAGALAGLVPPAPPPHSWASRPESDLAIWHLVLDPGAGWTLPPARPGTARVLYVFEAATIDVGGHRLTKDRAAVLQADAEVALANGEAPAECLLLQARPIGEPVAQYGPFVMNDRAEIATAFADYQRTGFGGWPWSADDPVHGRADRRFAIHADGRHEDAPGKAETAQAPLD
jgi:redox-sensitive bicupin YhaK (pirin superfamily)